MTNLIVFSDEAFEQKIVTLQQGGMENDAKVNQTVADVLEGVRNYGDKALLEYTQKFDHIDVATVSELRITENAIDMAYASCDKKLLSALELAAGRIKTYHEKQMPEDFEYQDDLGNTLGNRWNAVESAGLYVPGGLASYPSSVLMNAIPANVSGVERIVMTVPAPKGELNPLILVAAKLAGVKEIYTVGGAQAIAALAYGTETIDPVDVVVGPGNAYVAAAKRQVFGRVGIDMIAGPSDILVVADATSNPKWIAADLLSQAEHDKHARAILITDNEVFAGAVAQEVEATLATLEREAIARESWDKNGAIILVANLLDDAPNIVNKLAPEHLELSIDNPRVLLNKIKNAGAVFLGRHTPEAIGDYVAGPSHVLPTGGTARFSSGLSVYDFLKRSSIIACTEEGFDKLAQPTIDLAHAEGLATHALSAEVRVKK